MFHKDLKGQDLHVARSTTGSGSPVGVVTPNVIGLIYTDLSSGSIWVSTGPSNTEWILVTTGTPYIVTTFSLATASPLDFGALFTGDEILDSDVVIEVPFDDPTAMLSFGLVSSPGNILSTAAIDATTVGTYNNSEDFSLAAPDSLRLQILPGASTQGSGKVIVTVRRA